MIHLRIEFFMLHIKFRVIRKKLIGKIDRDHLNLINTNFKGE